MDVGPQFQSKLDRITELHARQTALMQHQLYLVFSHAPREELERTEEALELIHQEIARLFHELDEMIK